MLTLHPLRLGCSLSLSLSPALDRLYMTFDKPLIIITADAFHVGTIELSGLNFRGNCWRHLFRTGCATVMSHSIWECTLSLHCIALAGRNRHDFFEEWKRDLLAIKARPQNLVAAAHFFDVVYTKYMLGIDLLYFPWLCAYVNVSYLPTLSTFLIGSYRVEITIPGAVSGILKVQPMKAYTMRSRAYRHCQHKSPAQARPWWALAQLTQIGQAVALWHSHHGLLAWYLCSSTVSWRSRLTSRR